MALFFSLGQGDEDRASPGLLYGMPLTGTACALRDFAHAQNHPSDGRPHANGNTQRRMPAATNVSSTCQSRCRFALLMPGLMVIGIVITFQLLFVLIVVSHNGIYFRMGRFPALPKNPAVVLRIEPLRVSPRSGVHPSPRVKGIASGGLTAPALSPIAVGNLRGGMLFVLITLCSEDSL